MLIVAYSALLQGRNGITSSPPYKAPFCSLLFLISSPVPVLVLEALFTLLAEAAPCGKCLEHPRNF